MEDKAINQGITINELYAACKEQIKRGNGNLRIMISGDDEGNSYHELFYGFSSTAVMEFSNPLMACCLPHGISVQQAEKEYIILG